jgi:hypothetical protein
MFNVSFEEAALFEQRFWLQILGDHSRFIMMSLVSVEQEEIKTAACFIQSFDKLLMQVRRPMDAREFPALHQNTYQKACELRAFKLHLLGRLLQNDIKLQLPPTFINHMVNEIEEYLRILSYLLRGELPPIIEPNHLHLLWLPDASRHAAALSDNMDMIETKLIDASNGFAQLTLNPLFPDHMMREECYYLTKLAQVSEVRQPQCDPAKQRVAK